MVYGCDEGIVNVGDGFPVPHKGGETPPLRENMKQKINHCAQSTLEFTFAVVVVALLIYGLLRVFRWTGMDYAQHAYDQFQGFQDPPCGDLCGGSFISFEQAQLNAAAAGQRTQRIGAFTRKY